MRVRFQRLDLLFEVNHQRRELLIYVCGVEVRGTFTLYIAFAARKQVLGIVKCRERELLLGAVKGY